MPDKYYLYNLMADIANKGSLVNNIISKEEFLEKYEDSAKKAEMEKIFSIFDKCDMCNDGAIDLTAIYKDGLNKWRLNMVYGFFKLDTNTPENNPEFILDIPKNMQISKDNFQEALETLHKLVEKKTQDYKEARKKQKLDELKASNSEIPEKVLANIEHYLPYTTSIKIIDGGYEAVGKDGDAETIYKFDLEGNLVKRIDNYTDTQQGDFGDFVTSISIFDENGDMKETAEKYKEGYIYTYIPSEDKGVLKYGKTQVSYQYMEPREITINKGLPNETTFAVSTDDKGNITDISNADDNQILKISDKTKKCLITLLNKEGVCGRDFDLNVNCNEVSIKIIKDENIPKNAKSEIDKLGYAGMLKEKDYKTEQLENGDFAVEYLTNASRNFASDKKMVVYGADDSETIYEIKGDRVYITENSNVQEYSKEEFSAIKPEYNEWVNGYNTDKQENYELFKIEDSDFANKLYKVGKKEYLSDSAYTQQIGNSTYNVKLLDNKISVTKDGKEFFIDISSMTKGEAKFITESNPEALFRIAQKGIKLILQNPPSGGDGEYLPEENVIYIAPEASSVSVLQRRIAHEVGHSYYTHLNDINKELEESFKQESEQYEKEMEAIKASVTPEKSMLETGVKQGEALRKFDKYAPRNSDFRYCAENLYEFVAEAYCLLVTGNAKSEFTIAKVYPKTFELTKKMIEESH